MTFLFQATLKIIRSVKQGDVLVKDESIASIFNRSTSTFIFTHHTKQKGARVTFIVVESLQTRLIWADNLMNFS